MSKRWTFLVALSLLSFPNSSPAAEKEPAVERLGRTVTQYRDGLVRAVISTKYANAHLDRAWIPIEICIAAESGKPLNISREDITLYAEDGASMPLPTQKAMAEGMPDVKNVVQTANVIREPLTGYFPWSDRWERLRFFTVPGEHLVLDEEVVTQTRLAIGYLFFRSPAGTWSPGRYQLVIRNHDVNVKLPFRLPASDFPEKSTDPKVVPW